MLTKKQIEDLPKGYHPNWQLVQQFKTQGNGRSAKIETVRFVKEGRLVEFPALVNPFTGGIIAR